MSCPRQRSPCTIDVFLWVLKASALQRLGLTFSVASTFWVSRFQNTNPCLISSLGRWCPRPTQCYDSVIYSSHFIYQFLSVELPSVACFPGQILVVTETVCPSVLRLSSLTLVFLASCRVSHLSQIKLSCFWWPNVRLFWVYCSPPIGYGRRSLSARMK